MSPSVHMNSASISFILPSDIASKTGPRLLGALFHWGLFGVLSTQVFLYYLGFPNDPLKNKILVYLVYVLEILQTVLVTHSSFSVYAYGFTDENAYDNIELVWVSVPLLSGFVAFLTEIFYSHRIYLFTRSSFTPILIAVLALIQLGGSIASSVVLKDAKFFSRLSTGHGFILTYAIWNGGSALCDIVIAVSMTRFLWNHRYVGNKSTQALVRRIISRVLETGVVTALFAILTLVLTLIPSLPTYYQVPSAILAKVYSNSMMALLNSRITFNSRGNQDVEVSFSDDYNLSQ